MGRRILAGGCSIGASSGFKAMGGCGLLRSIGSPLIPRRVGGCYGSGL